MVYNSCSSLPRSLEICFSSVTVGAEACPWPGGSVKLCKTKGRGFDSSSGNEIVCLHPHDILSKQIILYLQAWGS